jgi:hypothetical protein
MVLAASAAASLGIAAAIALAAWIALLAALATWTRPHVPRPGAETMDLGAEPPAVAAFVTNQWTVESPSMSATLVDLAAKGVVAIEQVAPDSYVVRLTRDDKATNVARTDYEQLVEQRVRELAANGSVPADALALGDEGAAKAWEERFAKAVIADARARGLSRSRWSAATIAPLLVVALAVGALAGGAMVALPDQGSSSSSSNDNPVGAVLGITAIVTFFLMGIVRSMRAERDTAEGREAAARWLGVRKYLRTRGEFGDQPPAAVTVWGRYLAYAAALGLARATVRALPLGAEHPREVWSPNGGWHLVHIDLPGRLDVGWGRKPLGVLVGGVFAFLFGVFLLVVAGGFLVAIASSARDGLTNAGDVAWWVPLAIFGVIVLVMAWPVVFVGGLVFVGALQAARAALDLRRDEVTGQVVRVREWRVTDKRSYRVLVVDPGGVREVRAWCMPAAAPSGVARGASVRATVSPRLGHVWDLAVVGATETDRVS